jgi:hypothetical protein
MTRDHSIRLVIGLALIGYGTLVLLVVRWWGRR